MGEDKKETKVGLGGSHYLYAAGEDSERWAYDDITPGADHPDVFERLLTRVSLRDRLAFREIRETRDPKRLKDLTARLRVSFGRSETQRRVLDALGDVLEFEWLDYPHRYNRAAAICAVYERALNGDEPSARLCEVFTRTQLVDPDIQVVPAGKLAPLPDSAEHKQERVDLAVAATGGKVQRAAPIGSESRGRPKSELTKAERQKLYRDRKAKGTCE